MLREHFEEITDPRQVHKVKHSLLEIVIMTVCAVVTGCKFWNQIEDFCKVKEQWFRDKLKLGLNHGIPSHDTFQRIFATINPKEFEKNFVIWVRTICNLHKGEFVNIDGKTVCGSRKADDSQIHLVSAWANKNQLVLGQTKVADKSNEITAIPYLLDLLDVKNCIITIDAMGCQKAIAEKIVAKEAGYVLALKDNQKSLREDVEEYFKGIPYEKKPLFTDKTSGKGHGRIEHREYFLTTDIDWISVKEDWKDLKSIGMVKSRTLRKDKWVEETRYYISSVTEIEQFSKAVRSHWGVENSLHWCLDVIMDEDYCRSRSGHTAENFAIIRKIVMNMVRKCPTEKPMSFQLKWLKCGYDCNWVADVLLHSAA